MTRSLIAAGIIAAVLVGGLALGVIHAFHEEIGLDWLSDALLIYWGCAGALGAAAWYVLRWPK